MSLNFNALPALIALAILVAVFAAISRQHSRERVLLWLFGWALILLRAAVLFVRPAPIDGVRLDLTIGLCALELASIVFVVSVAPRASNRTRQLLLGAALAVPAILYTVAAVMDVTSHTIYYVTVLAGCIGSLVLVWRWNRKPTVYVCVVTIGVVV